MDQEILALDRHARSLADAYRRGELTLDQWEIEMRATVKNAHILSTALARGGIDRLTPADYGRIGAVVKREYGYLGTLADQLDIGIQPTDGRFMVRVQMFVRSGRRTFEATRTVEAQTRGFTEERSVLHPADHCIECVDQASIGWGPIGTLLPIGDRECLSNCQCTMDYR
jgi:hypothetical protein